MLPFKSWSKKTDPHFLKRKVVAFDLDDTLTVHGALPSSVIVELEKAQARGWLCVLVTGRSAGWVNALIKLLPFDAIVGENGALLAFWPKTKAKRKAREEPSQFFWTKSGYALNPPKDIRDRHHAAIKKLLKKFPRTRVASDQNYRIYDLAIDFAEEVNPPMSFSAAEKIKLEFERMGATAKVSSIHVNGWWGNFSKTDGLRELLRHYGFSLQKNLIYVGDSPNDAPLFESAGLSVGVANLRHFLGASDFTLPSYITRKEGGIGSIEVLKALKKRL